MMATNWFRAVRSELVRLRRMWTLPAAVIAITILATAVSFSGSTPGGPVSQPEGSSSNTASSSAIDELAAADGITTGISTAGTLVALLCLVMWALSIARDLQTGSIRILLVTQARRVVYLGGKLAALAIATIVTSIAAIATSVAVAYIAGPAQGVSTAAWEWNSVGSAMVNLGLTALMWGAIGALLAMLFRSAAAAIATGIGYLLLGERLIALVWNNADSWLPSGVSTALLDGGNDTTSYLHALVLALGYLALCGAVAVTVLQQRDITD